MWHDASSGTCWTTGGAINTLRRHVRVTMSCTCWLPRHVAWHVVVVATYMSGNMLRHSTRALACSLHMGHTGSLTCARGSTPGNARRRQRPATRTPTLCFGSRAFRSHARRDETPLHPLTSLRTLQLAGRVRGLFFPAPSPSLLLPALSTSHALATCMRPAPALCPAPFSRRS